MPRSQHAQLNIRSRYARDRATLIARATGMTATQVVEEALRAYVPSAEAPQPGTLVRRGPVLVRPAEGGRVSLEDANAALDAVRASRA